jgi:pimeloyl-ACP methyl ester carboxylesterase
VVDYRGFAEYRVPVEGGRLAVLRWAAADPGAPSALLVHGITGNALAWAAVAEAVAGRLHLLAPDLRGRAGSRAITGPWGIDRDAEDMVAVLDHFGLDRAVLAGHSLGAFVACTAAVRHPDRALRVLAVDGGLSFPVPEGLDPDAVLEATIGPAVRKLSMTFPDPDAYLDFHRDHPAFAGRWSPQLTAYLVRDTLVTGPGLTGSSCVEAAIRADGRQALLDASVRDALREVPCPATLLYAARGLFNEEQAVYDASRLALAALPPDRVLAELVPDTNHYTIVGPGSGADAIARHLTADARPAGSAPDHGAAGA